MARKHKDTLRGVKGTYTVVPHEVLESEALRGMSFSASKLYLALLSKYKGNNNGNLSLTYSELKSEWGFGSRTTIKKSFDELEQLGFIRPTRSTIGVHDGSTLCNLYRLTDRDSYGFPKLDIEYSNATREYLNYQSQKEAKK